MRFRTDQKEVNQMINRNYINDMGKSELVLSDGDITSFPCYYEKMIRHNDIPNVLKFSTEWHDGKVRFRYETDGRSPVSETFTERKPDSRKLKQLLLGIIRAVSEAQEYLIDEQDFVVRPDCIFENRNGEPGLVCLPGYGKQLREQFAELFEFMMNRLDYNDKRAVVTLYELYRRAKESTCSFDDMKAVIEKNMSLNGIPVLPGVTGPVDETSEDAETLCTGEKTESRKEARTGDKTVRSAAPGEAVSSPDVVEYHAEPSPGTKKQNGSAKKGFLASLRGKTPGENAKTTLLFEAPECSEYLLDPEDEKEKINLNKFPFFIGKKGANLDCELQYPQISRLHAKLTKDETETVYLEDMQSLNGCFVNGVRIVPGDRVPLKNRDEICLANIKYRFRRRDMA